MEAVEAYFSLLTIGMIIRYAALAVVVVSAAVVGVKKLYERRRDKRQG